MFYYFQYGGRSISSMFKTSRTVRKLAKRNKMIFINNEIMGPGKRGGYRDGEDRSVGPCLGYASPTVGAFGAWRAGGRASGWRGDVDVIYASRFIGSRKRERGDSFGVWISRWVWDGIGYRGGGKRFRWFCGWVLCCYSCCFNRPCCWIPWILCII